MMKLIIKNQMIKKSIFLIKRMKFKLQKKRFLISFKNGNIHMMVHG